MDRQKTIPPLSTKITRKLAQESADHNTLMNFYSQISRDETGAPKKWKMSSTLHIDEESIKSKKLSAGKSSGSGSNKGTPTNSRENSNERKNQINSSLQKSQKSGRKSRDESSSDQNSSRESSVENKNDDKKVKKKNTDKKGRSSSGDPGHHRKKQTSFSETGKRKRGPRPKSLDLSSKTMANGDDDNFKSPDPLTPCNIAVKRKKGRPKETPPVLYAEPPVEQSPVDSSVDSETEEPSPPIKRKPGRPKKVKVLTTLGKGEKLKSFNMKRYEGRGLKQYGSKLSKSNLTKGFRKITKVPTLKPVALSNENIESDISLDSMENDESRSEIKEKAQFKENGMSVEKRRPGRPPGAKNKKSFCLTSSFITRAKAVKPRNKSKFGAMGMKITVNRRPGRPPGAKNKTTLQKLAENVETVSNSSKENSVVAEKEEVTVSVESERDTSIALDTKPNAIDEAIESVVFKARNDLSLESNIKKRVPFRSQVFYKKLSSVKSVGKFKKEKDIIQKIRKKRILNAHYSDSAYGKEIELLASNDLRRKLHSKLLQKMSSESRMNFKATEVVSNANDNSERIDSSENFILDENKIKADTASVLSSSHFEESAGIGDPKINIPPGKIEDKKLFKPDTDQLIDNIKTVRKQSTDITKFSDTDSVCSELSTNSISSVRRNIEKQVLILGEDNLDSDDQTVRTRQRFEIIPGKKRKRTLSGEFDLLDEKQLRKEKRKVERGLTDDESEMNSVEPVVPVKKSLFKRKKSPLKKSPNLKVKEGKVVKKYISQLTAYRHRMLKQSPFLSRVRKKRRKHLRKGVSDSLLDSLKKSNSELSLEQTSYEKPLLETTSNKQLRISGKSPNVTPESGMVKSESYRKGLFEKFTNVTLENKTDLVVKKVASETRRKQKHGHMDSDDTEQTFDLKEDIFNEDPDDILVEESVDDSDIIDFHAEVDTESSCKELYTESEIDVREMLFDLINEVVMKCEPKNDWKMETSLEKQFDKDNEEKLCMELVKETFMDNSNEKSCGEETGMLLSEKHAVTASEQKTGVDEIAKEVGKVSHMLSELKPLENSEIIMIKDSESIHEKAEMPGVDYIPKLKHKVRRRKFGPKSLARKEHDNVIKEFKVRKKPGRKPKKAIEQGAVNDIDAKLQNAARSPNESKSSPETNTMRKFELRQKISRSPLDNIALKQSIEENVYLRNEAQKASRKEAKLKTKAKLAVQDSLELMSYQAKDVDTYEKTWTEMPVPTATETLSEKETASITMDDLLKACKPCKVVLKDFIKELERTQEGENYGDSEIETHEIQNVSDDEKNLDNNIPGPAIEAVSETQSDCTIQNSENNESVSKMFDMPDSLEASTAVKCATIDNERSIANEILNNEPNSTKEILQTSDNKIVENQDSDKLKEMAENSGDVNENEKKDIIKADITPDKKLREFRPKRKTPAKSEEKSSPKPGLCSPKEIKKSICFNEQQTARKTVPPLKIKVKGGVSSRRKTYMVEPSPDSPVEEFGKNEHKTEKRKGKNKAKTGNKSESDSEKHIKGHHHHKKRNKTPTEEVSSQQNKASSTTHIFETLSGTLSMMPEKPAVRATDAYEATFLQFIQDKDKNEQNHTAFSSTYGSRNKLTAQNMQKTHHKDSKSNSEVATSVSLSVNSAKDTENVPVPGVNGSPDSVDNSEVQYVCSQCDNVVYKAKEQIIQHYRDVHPGLQFIYKPLTEADDNLTSANDIVPSTIHSGQDEKSATANSENNLNQASSDANDQPPDDDDDSGSLNLKIVEVVSLKDQQNIIDNAEDVSKEDQVTTVSTMLTSHMQTELRVPSYPVPPPPYPIKCVPPPPYSIAASGTLLNMNTAVQEMSQLKPQASVKPRTQVQSGKIGSSFKCEKCNVHAPMLAAMVAHLRNSHKEIPRLFQCPYCKDMEAETEAMIHQHIKKHHPTNNPNPPVALSEPAKRNLKTLSVRLPDGLKLGEGNSIEKDIYMCLKCKEHMPSLETIYEHLEHEHTEVFAYVCPVCKVFKSKTEDLVNNHIVTHHGRSPVEVNVSLAIDGNHFVRIQCLIKDKGKSGQKSVPSVTHKTQISPVSNVMHPNKSAIQVHGQAAANVFQLQPITQAVLPQEATLPSQSVTSSQPVNASHQQTILSVTTQPEVSKPAAPPVQKKKKSLLESIQKIKDQKLEQQGLQPQKNGASATQIVPSHPSQLSSGKSVSGAGGVPPPLMRAPPPLIRYDQLNKVSSAQAVMFSSAVRTSSQFTFSNQTMQTSVQRLQSIAGTFPTQSVTAARPIQSSLFDTSDLDSLKSPQNQTTVLNVPIVPRRTNKSPFPKSPPLNSLSEGTAVVTSGSPLDLSKTTPTGSPAPQNIQSASPGHLQLPNGGVNPDVFQVFNLRPSTQMQLPRQQVPVQQMIAQPIMLPQQVRQNTPSTLAYRPAGPHMIATSQVQQIIGMPVGTALIGNVVVSLGNVSQSLPTVSGVTQIPPNAQFVRMASPQMPTSAVTVLNSSETSVATQAQPKTNGTGQQFLSKNMLFKCPYCPTLTPLRLDQVQHHIENKHPGSTILFKPFDSK